MKYFKVDNVIFFERVWVIRGDDQREASQSEYLMKYTEYEGYFCLYITDVDGCMLKTILLKTKIKDVLGIGEEEFRARYLNDKYAFEAYYG